MPEAGTHERQHDTAVRLVQTWVAPDPDQARLRLDFLTVLAGAPDALSRSCLPAHLTASAVVLDHARAHVLLVRHARLGCWVQAGGHVEPGDRDLAAAARREAVEETGIADLDLDPRPVMLSRHPAPCAARWHLDVQFLALADRSAMPVVSAESSAVAWFPVSALPTDRAGGVAELVAAAAGRHLPR